MKTSDLHIRLSKREAEFVKRYAEAHHLTVDEVIDRSLRLLERLEEGEIHPDVKAISGLVPPEVDAVAEHKTHRQHQP